MEPETVISNPAPIIPEAPSPQTIPPVPQAKKFPLFTSLLLIFLSLFATLSIYLFFQVRSMTLQKYAPSPTPVPVASTDPTADWQVYLDSTNGFSFKYPKNYSLSNYIANDLSTPRLINNRIDWNISTTPASNCKGPCPIILSTESINISQNLQATKIAGWIGGIGGEIPQSYLAYEILLPSGKYLDINLWELLRGQASIPENYPADRYPGPINQEDVQVFEQILSTFKFTDSPTTYTCPVSGYADCMPGPGAPKPSCTKEAMSWYEANCPTFQGGAL